VLLRLLTPVLFISTLSAADLTGTWEIAVQGGQMTDARRVQITSDNSVYKWKFLGFDYTGTAHGDSVEFQCKRKDAPSLQKYVDESSEAMPL
jgi:hypothetical protein